MQLLQITSTPMQYELQITRAKLETSSNHIPVVDMDIQDAKLDIKTKNIKVKLDTYEARKSLGFAKVGDRIRMAADRGKELLSRAIREDVVMGAQMAKIEDRVTISQLIRQKLTEQPSSYVAFLPSVGADISWQPNEISKGYKAGKINYDWKPTRCNFNYVPGSVKMKITQYASVKIKYLGGPMYIPRSADPNYVSTEA